MRKPLLSLLLLGMALPASGYVLTGFDWSYQAFPVEETWRFKDWNWPGSAGTAAEVETAYAAAIDTWNDQGASAVTLSYGGTVANGSWSDDNRNVGQYQPTATTGTTVALAQVTASGGDILDCDIRFYDSNGLGPISWSSKPAGASAGEIDLQLTATHELGHCIGFDHSAVSGSIMEATVVDGTGPAERNLDADDIAGLQDMYGAEGGPVLQYADRTWFPANPDGDNDAEPGEEWALRVFIDNVGTASATGLRGNLSTTNTDVTITVPSRAFSNVDPGGTSSNTGLLRVLVDAGCTSGDVDLDLEVTHDDGVTDLTLPPLPILCGPAADLVYAGQSVAEVTGDGDLLVEPGETWELVVDVNNPRGSSATGVSGVLSTASLDLSIGTPGASWDDIGAGLTGANTTPFTFTVDPGCVDTTSVRFDLAMTDDAVDSDLTVDVPVSCPPPSVGTELFIQRDRWFEGVGDGDLLPEAGERWHVLVWLENGGSTTATGVSGVLSTSNPNIASISVDTQLYADIPANGGWQRSGAAYRVEIANTCTETDEVLFDLTVTESNGSGVLPMAPWFVECGSGPIDADADGYTEDVDCDDNNAAVNPAAPEVCDTIDNDCDGNADGNAVDAGTWHPDVDGDGWGDQSVAQKACVQPSGTVVNGTDCDDANAAVHPTATEVCDGVDNNCSGTVDVGASDAKTFYLDGDGDLYGTPTASALGCTAPSGYVDDASDCNDADATINPSASEVCDTRDNDCDGQVDVGAIDATTWYADADNDTFGSNVQTADACARPVGYVATAGDCDDANHFANPGITESCNGVDDNCDGTIDNGAIDAPTWYIDIDGDGFGTTDFGTIVACIAPTNGVGNDDDCDDTDASVFPGANEVCDNVDNDCDGNIDGSGSGVSTFYTDLDGDGFGDANSPVLACSQPSGTVADALDCDDSNADINPNSDELCDDTDHDCDGATREDDAIDALTWYWDNDSDGYGSAANATTACDQPSKYWVLDSTDCNDANPDANPGAVEEWYDGRDQDCDGNDADQDVDGYTFDVDCDDTDPRVFPGDGVHDEDCLTAADRKADKSDRVEGCGCSSAPSPVGGLLLLGIVAGMLRRE